MNQKDSQTVQTGQEKSDVAIGDSEHQLEAAISEMVSSQLQ